MKSLTTLPFYKGHNLVLNNIGLGIECYLADMTTGETHLYYPQGLELYVSEFFSPYTLRTQFSEEHLYKIIKLLRNNTLTFVDTTTQLVYKIPYLDLTAFECEQLQLAYLVYQVKTGKELHRKTLNDLQITAEELQEAIDSGNKMIKQAKDVHDATEYRARQALYEMFDEMFNDRNIFKDISNNSLKYHDITDFIQKEGYAPQALEFAPLRAQQTPNKHQYYNRGVKFTKEGTIYTSDHVPFDYKTSQTDGAYITYLTDKLEAEAASLWLDLNGFHEPTREELEAEYLQLQEAYQAMADKCRADRATAHAIAKEWIESGNEDRRLELQALLGDAVTSYGNIQDRVGKMVQYTIDQQ